MSRSTGYSWSLLADLTSALRPSQKRVGEIIKMKAASNSRISRLASRKHEVEAHGQQVVGAVGSWFLQARKKS